MLVATVNAAPAWVAYSYNIHHLQRPWVIAMSWSAANVDVWHCWPPCMRTSTMIQDRWLWMRRAVAVLQNARHFSPP